MDVDAFMNGGMFGLDVDENGKQYDEGSETEEGTEDEEGEEGEEDEEEEDDELLNGGDDAENVRVAWNITLRNNMLSDTRVNMSIASTDLQNDDSGSGSENDEAADEMTKCVLEKPIDGVVE